MHIRNKKNDFVIIVSGLPRSGTSVMMGMLAAGGLSLLTDGQRSADIDNPRGYFEFERVKKMSDGDTSWILDSKGKVVKVISALLTWLPPSHSYKVLFMRRPISEILTSQKKMLKRRGIMQEKVGDEEMTRIFEKHLEDISHWAGERKYISLLNVEYTSLISHPAEIITNIERFLNVSLNKEKMVEIVDPNLYRNRHASGNER